MFIEIEYVFLNSSCFIFHVCVEAEYVSHGFTLFIGAKHVLLDSSMFIGAEYVSFDSSTFIGTIFDKIYGETLQAVGKPGRTLQAHMGDALTLTTSVWPSLGLILFLNGRFDLPTHGINPNTFTRCSIPH